MGSIPTAGTVSGLPPSKGPQLRAISRHETELYPLSQSQRQTSELGGFIRAADA